MPDATQNFADPLTQERPFGWHAAKVLGEASARVRVADHLDVTRVSSPQARHERAPIRR